MAYRDSVLYESFVDYMANGDADLDEWKEKNPSYLKDKKFKARYYLNERFHEAMSEFMPSYSELFDTKPSLNSIMKLIKETL